MWNKITGFLTEGIWHTPGDGRASRTLILLRPLRVFLLAARGFDDNKCRLRASALTFYTLMAIVPVLALSFAVAKGFGFEENLRTIIQNNLVREGVSGSEDLAAILISMSQKALTYARGGYIAGVGVVILLWSVIGLLGTIEASFNDIWGLRKGRSLSRKLIEYPAIILIAPIVLLLSSSLSVLVTARIQTVTHHLAEQFAWLEGIEVASGILIALLPLLLLWVLFAFLYRFVPNTHVSRSAGLYAAILAGTIYQVVQWAYVELQVGVSKVSAIYGSFAALPLFLIWLQISWHVVLFGAEVAFSVDNEETYAQEKTSLEVSHRRKNLLALRIAELCVKAFRDAKDPLDAASIAHALSIPVRLTREILEDLTRARLLSEILVEGDERAELFQPAQDLEHITVKKVLDALDRIGASEARIPPDPELRRLQEKLEAFDRLVAQSPDNVRLRDL